jgi:hypothetical protein
MSDGEAARWAAIVVKYAETRCHTDIEGKYEASLPGGRFVAFASLETAYSTIIWFLPVNITGKQDLQLDLRNENADFISNKNP